MSPLTVFLYTYTGVYNSILDGTLENQSVDLVISSTLSSIFLYTIGSLVASLILCIFFFNFYRKYNIYINGKRVFLLAAIYGGLFVLVTFTVDFLNTILQSNDNTILRVVGVLYLCIGVVFNLLMFKQERKRA